MSHLVTFTELQRDIHKVVDDYVHKHTESPKSITLSREFYPVIATGILQLNGWFTNGVLAYQGLHLKFTKRKNYIEAMPRKKKNQQCFQMPNLS